MDAGLGAEHLRMVGSISGTLGISRDASAALLARSGGDGDRAVALYYADLEAAQRAKRPPPMSEFPHMPGPRVVGRWTQGAPAQAKPEKPRLVEAPVRTDTAPPSEWVSRVAAAPPEHALLVRRADAVRGLVDELRKALIVAASHPSDSTALSDLSRGALAAAKECPGLIPLLRDAGCDQSGFRRPPSLETARSLRTSVREVGQAAAEDWVRKARLSMESAAVQEPPEQQPAARAPKRSREARVEQLLRSALPDDKARVRFQGQSRAFLKAQCCGEEEERAAAAAYLRICRESLGAALADVLDALVGSMPKGSRRNALVAVCRDSGVSPDGGAKPHESVRADPGGVEPASVGGGEHGRAEPSRAEPSRAEPSRAEPSRAEPSRAEHSCAAEHSRAAEHSCAAEHSRAEPRRAAEHSRARFSRAAESSHHAAESSIAAEPCQRAAEPSGGVGGHSAAEPEQPDDTDVPAPPSLDDVCDGTSSLADVLRCRYGLQLCDAAMQKLEQAHGSSGFAAGAALRDVVNLDLAECGGGRTLPRHLGRQQRLHGRFFTQVQAARDVLRPLPGDLPGDGFGAGQAGARRMLRLTLIDGCGGSVTALEQVPWLRLSDVVPGSKLLLLSPRVQGSFLLLEEGGVEPLRGCVAQLAHRHRVLASGQRAVRLAGEREGGPPKFVPFGSKQQPEPADSAPPAAEGDDGSPRGAARLASVARAREILARALEGTGEAGEAASPAGSDSCGDEVQQEASEAGGEACADEPEQGDCGSDEDLFWTQAAGVEEAAAPAPAGRGGRPPARATRRPQSESRPPVDQSRPVREEPGGRGNGRGRAAGKGRPEGEQRGEGRQRTADWDWSDWERAGWKQGSEWQEDWRDGRRAEDWHGGGQAGECRRADGGWGQSWGGGEWDGGWGQQHWAGGGWGQNWRGGEWAGNAWS
eukprot:TRINITY_DN2848_c0_g1_i3.p1 TRINITY_DN2848_c0_g1~~TRINITY_DN2848_c0_g1_i3.p1  ORF type:complete len:928 (+),score=194.46 TRINITY_DN2848_c0_g1_i3:62-2845(+)